MLRRGLLGLKKRRTPLTKKFTKKVPEISASLRKNFCIKKFAEEKKKEI